MIRRTFHRVLIPCSAACSSNFRICSAESPALSAAWSLSNTCLSSIADRTVETLKSASLGTAIVIASEVKYRRDAKGGRGTREGKKMRDQCKEGRMRWDIRIRDSIKCILSSMEPTKRSKLIRSLPSASRSFIVNLKEKFQVEEGNLLDVVML